jgi:signal recognition particle subunit SRP54
MFESLTGSLSSLVKNLQGRGHLTRDNIQESMQEVRNALIEADAGYDAVQSFLEQVAIRAEGEEVVGSLTPGQTFVKIVQDELTKFMGDTSAELSFSAQPPVVILVAGLQGSGKTTTIAKLARRLIRLEKKQVGVVSCDIHRPAAVEQLKILASEVSANYYETNLADELSETAKNAIDQSKIAFDDVLLVDTAGRLTIDDAMMQEIASLHRIFNPLETLFVIDSMMGQDAVETARNFNEVLPLTGVVLTKIDGDSRGGAALSVREVTGKPIKFMGTGEKVDDFDVFHPDRIASRILGMGDVLSLIEEVEQKVDKKKAEKVAKKLKSGNKFDLQDFRDQLEQMGKMGGVQALMGKLPGMQGMSESIKEKANDKEMVKFSAIIDSMTVQERLFPALIKGSRKRRIANGSGTIIQDVNRLLKQFTQMQKMMKKMSKKGGMKNLMRGMGGQLPPNFPQ